MCPTNENGQNPNWATGSTPGGAPLLNFFHHWSDDARKYFQYWTVSDYGYLLMHQLQSQQSSSRGNYLNLILSPFWAHLTHFLANAFSRLKSNSMQKTKKSMSKMYININLENKCIQFITYKKIYGQPNWVTGSMVVPYLILFTPEVTQKIFSANLNSAR